ncbi:hypothetical protein CGMCC3_g17081 [Colletotrichum fructicola]|uniref:Uncharacterized protein n=1 Tax=Colletotrichum fructicola (strain Nara gc5) TaxID=1213859 RepID=A0A7J6IFX7_COLFN|nr:uncharacterized protein CGMCC3_g17081 [Colletotrichum fructicola]KAE9566746.1 hypothetical protein CGMCC3_g17081 [Colletotrichum fructicola]KAF4417849.1 hypothetical protein CFRS1_v015122 [Colletotrichum fructicola]KAF4474884.1 hypothetical protein CGGC5_v016023 [Colletotrichum fructicola Nara gc5]
MGNVESRQFADALSSLCQGADDIGEQLQDSQFLSALRTFLRHVELVWDKLPTGVTNVIKQKFLPSFNSEKDIDAWVLHEIFHISRFADDPPTDLYRQINEPGPSDRATPQLIAARKNVWLVAFARVHEQFQSKGDRSALARHLQERLGDVDKKVRKNCSAFATAGARLEMIANEVGGCGALICGLKVPSSTINSHERFNKRNRESIHQTVDQELAERRNPAVHALLSVYEQQVCAHLNRQGLSKKRKRADQQTQAQSRARTAENLVQLSNGRGEPTPETIPEVVPEAVPDTAMGQLLPGACSSSVSAFPGHYYAESDDIPPPHARMRHQSAAPPTNTTTQATRSPNWGYTESFYNNNSHHSLDKRPFCAAPLVGIPSSVTYAPGHTRQQPDTTSNLLSYDVSNTPIGGRTEESREPISLPYHFDTTHGVIDLGKLPSAAVQHRSGY